jgi:hypothetical protein
MTRSNVHKLPSLPAGMKREGARENQRCRYARAGCGGCPLRWCLVVLFDKRPHFRQLTLNQRVQGSSPCAPTIEITKEILTRAGTTSLRNAFGSAPGKHFLQKSSRRPDTQRGHPGHGPIERRPNPHFPMVGGDQDGGELSSAPTDALQHRTIPSRASEPIERDLIATTIDH